MRTLLMASAAALALAGPVLAQNVTTTPLPVPDAAASSRTVTVNPDGSTTMSSQDTVVNPTSSGTVTTTTETTTTTPPAPPTSVVNANTPHPVTPRIDPAISALNASRLIGEDVYGTAGEELGEITDILLNDQGQAAAALVQVEDTGFLGFGKRQVMIDLTQFRMHDGHIVVSMLTLDQLNSMPEYRQSMAWRRADRNAPVGVR